MIGDLKQGKIFSDSASDVGCVKNLYTMYERSAKPDNLIEDIWARYETDLPSSVEKLISGSLDAETWARILVPFVAGLFVRGTDFNNRFNSRLNALGIETISKDNTNGARLFELQRLLAPVIASKWIVIKVNGDRYLITNDLGYAPFVNPHTGDKGIAIPLGLHHILAISPLMARTIAYADGGSWIPVIEYVEEPPNSHLALNNILAFAAQRFIFGPDEESIKRNLSITARAPHVPEPQFFGFISGSLARAYEFTWHRLVSVLRKHPDNKGSWDFSIDWEIVADGWYPPVMLPTNLIEFPPAIRRVRKSIYIKFYDPDVFYTISRCLYHHELGASKAVIDEATKALSHTRQREYKYRILIVRAEAYVDLDDFDNAQKDCLAAIRLYPKKPDAYTNQGYILVKIGQLDDAINLFTKAIELDSSHGPAFLDRASCLAQLNRFLDIGESDL